MSAAAARVPAQYEIAIVGGGLVGACAAALLARHSGVDPRRLVLLEPDPPAAPGLSEPLDLRVSALSRASQNILAASGVWQHLDRSRICAYERMHVWHAGVAPFGGAALVFDAADLAIPDLGCILENRLVQSALIAAFVAAGGQLMRAQLAALELRSDFAVLELKADAGAPASASGLLLGARLVVGSDGARSLVREQAQLESETHDYGQLAIVASVTTEQPHAVTAWQCFLDSGPLAFLPLADGNCSIVWSCVAERAQALLALSPADFALALDQASDLALGRTRLVSERLSFPVRGLSATRYVTGRCALIGDAAHVIHPLAGQGVNLGLLDAAELCEQLTTARATREDPGALRLLRRYERARKADNELMAFAVDQFDRAFTTDSHPRSGVRGMLARAGLPLVNRSGAARRFFMRHALGLTGDLPSYARARG